ncbi:acetyl-CoA carboxylase biotin carboxyl carrier protein [Sanyastnella coralliicola]|uniref:acetyl-CoA carboxylase biotin carboxyl carrier protein n=1 Tax=Sanyastnella coralliicola TaxID=3069118 RepID=UPI0027B9D2C6|nr:acetyl-CoA carboxylase biotin carboxyl carrier protein [Longitalea sp. SCSIO 12813]
MNLNEIQDLIKFVAKAGVTEVEIEQKDFKITIKSDMPNKKGRRQDVEAQIMPVQMPVQGMPAMAMPAAPVPQPVAAAPAPAAAPAAAEPAAAEENSNYITIKSPMIGTFYRRPSPDKDNFIEVGQTIKPGDCVCIIEAMKLFNEIEAEVSGKVVKVLVDDSTPVEYDQPLIVIDPS